MSNEQAIIIQPLIDQALADLARLDARAQRVREQLAEIDEEATPLRGFVTVARKHLNAGSKQETNGSASTTASTSDTADGRTLTRRVTDMAVDLIKAKGQPIRTRDLLAQMDQQGLIVGGQNRITNLSGILTRDKKRLMINRKLGWRLVEWGGDTPPAA